MTIIAAYEDKDTITIGSDSHGLAGELMLECGSKLIAKGDYALGFSWSYRVADIIREDKVGGFPKTIRNRKDIQVFRDVLKAYMIEDGAVDKADEAETIMHPTSLLIACKSGMYTIDSDYSVHKAREGYQVNGSGSQIALGVLYAAKKLGLDSKKAVKMAVEAAMRYISGCGGNIHLKTIKKK